MQEKLFFNIGSIISSSATYNDQSVVIDKEKISKNLVGFKQSTVEKIIFAAQKIAEEQSARIEKDALSLQYNLEGLKGLLNSFETSDEQTKILQKNELLNTLLDNDIIEDSGFVEKIKTSIDRVYSAIAQGEIDNEIPGACRQLNTCIENLRHYKDNIKLPSCVDELFVRQENNKAAVEKNVECIKELKGKVSVVSFEDKNSLGDHFHLFFNHSKDLQDAMSKNNNLLSRIENEMNAKKDAASRVINAFEKFQSVVSDLVILKYLASNDHAIDSKLESFITSLKLPEELSSVSLINNQLKILKEFSIKDEMQTIKILEAALDLKSSLWSKLNKINESIAKINQSLEIHRNKLLSNEKSPIPESIFVFERSDWQSFKTFFANCSKFFIGDVSHCALYGHPDGVEELRRAIYDIPDDTISGLQHQF